MDNSLASKFKTELASQIIRAITAGTLVIILSRILDPDGYGLLYLAISVLSIIEVFSRLGIAKSTARYLAESGDKDRKQQLRVIGSGLILSLGLLSVTTPILYFVSSDISMIMNEPELELLLQLGMLYLIFKTIFLFVRRCFQGLELIQYSSILSAAEHILRLIFVLLFVFIGLEVVGAFLGYIIAYFIISIIGFLFLLSNYYHILKTFKLDVPLIDDIAKYAVPLTASSTANVVDKRVDEVILGFFLGPAYVGYFVVSKQVVQFVETPVSALGYTVSPTIASRSASAKNTKAAEIYLESLNWILKLYIPAITGLIFISENLIIEIFGNDYAPAISVLQIMSLYVLIQAITKITSNSLDYLGRAKVRAYAKILTSILHVMLSIPLIISHGIIGAAIATVASYSLYCGVCVWVMQKEIPIQLKSVLKPLSLTVFCTLIMTALLIFTIPFVNSIWSLLLVVCGSAILWGLSALSIGLVNSDELLQFIEQ